MKGGVTAWDLVNNIFETISRLKIVHLQMSGIILLFKVHYQRRRHILSLGQFCM